MTAFRRFTLAGIGAYCGVKFQSVLAHTPCHDPVQLIRKWYEESKVSGVDYTDAMFLSTTSSNGQPSCRAVLCKEIGDDFSLKFHSHSTSQKGRDLESNPKASALFFWRDPERQVRVEGYVEPIPEPEVVSYWNTRLRISQLGAHASRQSELLSSREDLLQRVEFFDVKFPNQVPKPENWVGYRLVALKVEFWQNGENRLHNRWQYSRTNVTSDWEMVLLNP